MKLSCTSAVHRHSIGGVRATDQTPQGSPAMNCPTPCSLPCSLYPRIRCRTANRILSHAATYAGSGPHPVSFLNPQDRLHQGSPLGSATPASVMDPVAYSHHMAVCSDGRHEIDMGWAISMVQETGPHNP